MSTEQKYDRALEEVWEWRRKAGEYYKSLEKLSAEERTRAIRKDTDELLAELGLDLPRLSRQPQS